MKNIKYKWGLLILVIIYSVFIKINNVNASQCVSGLTTMIEISDSSSTVLFLRGHSFEGNAFENVDYTGISFNEETNTLTLDNIDITGKLIIWAYRQDDTVITINLIGDNIINGTVIIYDSDVIITGDGNLTTNITDSGKFYVGTECGDVYSSLTFNMSGTVTINGAFYYDEEDEEDAIILGDGVSFLDGYDIYTVGGVKYFSFIDLTDTIIYTRDLSGGLSDSTIVISGQEVNNSLTNEDETIKFTSSTLLDEKYYLKAVDKTDDLTSEEISNITSSQYNSELLFLYDISVLDEENQKVSMENGNYKIRFYLSEEERNSYDSLVGVYINENGDVSETYDLNINGDYVELVTTHLSDYGILGLSEDYLMGDMNNNGVIDISDVILLIKAYFNDDYQLIGDMNNNSVMDVSDIILLIKVYFNS